jgi:hypothetical protein
LNALDASRLPNQKVDRGHIQLIQQIKQNDTEYKIIRVYHDGLHDYFSDFYTFPFSNSSDTLLRAYFISSIGYV